MKYKEYKETMSKEINRFVDKNCIWAFGKEQLEQALTEHNLTQEQFNNEFCGFIGGGAKNKKTRIVIQGGNNEKLNF